MSNSSHALVQFDVELEEAREQEPAASTLRGRLLTLPQ